ncbi:heparinase II/III family protein [bacterium]|nr:heparinase II/III family protein [bacterium]
MKVLFRYGETLRHLKGRQILAQLLGRGKKLPGVRDLLRWKLALPLSDQSLRHTKHRVSPPLRRRWRSTAISIAPSGECLFHFLNERRSLEEGWFPDSASDLWSFHLHYFEYLTADVPPEKKLELIERWLDEVPLGDPWAWHPYPTSVRVPHWIGFLEEYGSSLSDEQRKEILSSLRRQLAHLRGNLEYGILGNHLLKNITALILGGCFFGDRHLVDLGKELLEQEIAEQILSDGGHFEKSPSYHLIVLEDLFSIASALTATGYAIPTSLRAALVRMAQWADIVFQNGQFPALNDSSEEVAPPWTLLREELEHARLIPPRKKHRGTSLLKETGLAIYHEDSFSLFFDGGSIGPDYLPGHAHNDTLSFLLFVDGAPLLTDAGVYEYTEGEWRHLFRSARSHNVVMIDGEEPNDIWKSFRVGYRGAPTDLSVGPHRFSARDTAYERYGVHWEREIEIRPEHHEITVRDRFKNTGQSRDLDWRLHFAPGISFQPSTRDQTERKQLGNSDISVTVTCTEGGLPLRESSSWYSSEFGKKEERACLHGEQTLLPGTHVITTTIHW